MGTSRAEPQSVQGTTPWPDDEPSTAIRLRTSLAERSLRAQALGRKNDLFIGSDRGGRTATTRYRFVGRCKRLGTDPFADLKDVLVPLPTHPRDHLGELLPDTSFTVHPTTQRMLAF